MLIHRDDLGRFLEIVLGAGDSARKVEGRDGSWIEELSVRRVWNSSIEVPNVLPAHILEALVEFYTESGDKKSRLIASAILKGVQSPEGATTNRLAAFPGIFYAWMQANCPSGWLYLPARSGKSFAYLCVSAEFQPESNRGGSPVPACVELRLIANSPVEDRAIRNVTLEHLDISGKTVPEVLAANGFLAETPELRAEYDASVEAFLDIEKRNLQQYRLTGKAEAISRSYSSQSLFDDGGKVVIDMLERRRGVSLVAQSKIVSAFTEDNDGMLAVPFHPHVRAYHLAQHQHVRVHALDLELYQWDERLAEKLILPPEHSDLISLLSSEADVLAEDIVEGKTGGTIILCFGAPGSGKTLTAEVYSEVSKRPLFRVHSGQIGTEPQRMEESIRDYFKMAKHLNAAMLIDEADVFVRSRGDNILQNAVTSVFLRTMEYWDGLLFMTTNRQGDIDEAIVSRCMAIVAYDLPTLEARKKIWRVLSRQFEVLISDDLCDRLAERFDKVSGRDIKGLLRLTKRYVEKRGGQFSEDDFVRMSAFRGVRSAAKGADIGRAVGVKDLDD